MSSFGNIMANVYRGIIHKDHSQTSKNIQTQGLALTERQISQQREIARLKSEIDVAIHQNTLEHQRQQFEKQKELQKELAAYNRETQISLAVYQRETTLQLPEVNKLFENWPLRIVPSTILNFDVNAEKDHYRF